MSTTTRNETRTGAFEDRLVEVLNAGAFALVISIGHRTGLFDAMATMSPSSSAEIAEEAAMHDRYVCEKTVARPCSRRCANTSCPSSPA